MFNFCSLYSGSSGNSLFVESNNFKILIDAGESAKKIENSLSILDVDINSIDAILVTHEHSDHIKSLGTLSKKYNIPVYANSKTWAAMPEQKIKIVPENQCLYEPYQTFEIGDLKIYPFETPHDAANSCGFNILHKDKKISIVTDLGHITEDIFNNLEKSSFILIESNYDLNTLKCSRYPYMLKQRIASPTGHLSNNLTGQTIAKLIKSGLNRAMLGHLSKENNFPELAYKTVIEELMNDNYDENAINISVAKRDSPTKLITIE